MVEVPKAVIERYERFSLYNSPYPAHDLGCAIDLYPGTDAARSPVSGVVRTVQSMRCPTRPYADPEDHLIVVDCGEHVARLLHVDPAVEVGSEIGVGDRLGTLVRSGFFGQWVRNHIHLGFRHPEQNAERASGSLRVEAGVSVAGIEWDGTGAVVEAGPTHVRLDSPIDGDRDGFTAIADDDGIPLDGGLTHYSGGGTFSPATGNRSLLGATIGTADGRDLRWADVRVSANGRPATGLSLFATRKPFGAKLVFREGHGFSVGDGIEVSIDPTAEPIRLG